MGAEMKSWRLAELGGWYGFGVRSPISQLLLVQYFAFGGDEGHARDQPFFTFRKNMPASDRSNLTYSPNLKLPLLNSLIAQRITD